MVYFRSMCSYSKIHTPKTILGDKRISNLLWLVGDVQVNSATHESGAQDLLVPVKRVLSDLAQTLGLRRTAITAQYYKAGTVAILIKAQADD
jgi:hypothetical protein